MLFNVKGIYPLAIMKGRYSLILFLLLALPARFFAQTDTLFWFAVPYATLSHDPPLTAVLTLTATDLNSLTTVTISQPYNPQIAPITVVIDPAVALTKNVTFTQADILKFSNNLYNTVSNSALLIRADREITAYYEIHRTDNNPSIFALKGKNALGYDFWTLFQDKWPNHDYDKPGGDPAFSQIVIVATEDNTVVTVRFSKPAYGYAANTNYTINLNRGQTYMFVPRPNPADNNEPSILPADRLTGTHITSNKPIAVTLGDDSVEKSTAYDYMGDQHIPVRNVQNKAVIGFEYIVMKGQIADLAGGQNEKAYVLATQNNTTVTVTRRDGSTSTFNLATAGTQGTIDILAGNPAYYYVHISADKPVYVLHIAGFTHELGEAVLPTIDGCTGSLSVSFTRSKPDTFYLNLMTKADAIDSFYISINGGPPVRFLNASYFEQAGTSDWYVLKEANKRFTNSQIPSGVVTRIYNSKNVFHLGFFNGKPTGGGCVYGYFSDYNELEASASVEDQGTVFQVCGADSIQLKAKGGISYHWSPTEYLDDPNVQNPILRPPYGGFSQVFTVDIEQPCYGFTTLQVWVIVPEVPNAFMAVDYDQGCAPLNLELRDASQGATGYILDLGDGSPLMMSSSPINLDHAYGNNTDTIINYILSYTVTNDDGCNDYYTDTVRVYPWLDAHFELDDWKDTVVCHSTTVDMRSLSTGNTDTYLWDFGDGSSATDTVVSHTYDNFGNGDAIYPVSLIAVSPFGCHDTSDVVGIRVHPYILSSFTMDSARLCSPAELYIDPRLSVGADTFYWKLSGTGGTVIDSSFVLLNESPFRLLHRNTSRPVPDSLQLSMYASNRFGCTDTAAAQNLVVYPEVQSLFTIDTNVICDSSAILFTNLSQGFNLSHKWDFGNGTSISDTSMLPFTRVFLNPSAADTTYRIRLLTTSDYFCADSASLDLTVHPFIRAGFAVDYTSNCSPLNVQLVNASRGGATFSWDFGDGQLDTTYAADTLYHLYVNNTDNDASYTIRMRALSAQGCADSAEHSVLLFPRVAAGFTFDSPTGGCNPPLVSFLNESEGKDLNYLWDFGDRTYSTSESPPPKLYRNDTNRDTAYTITLTVTNPAGCDSSISRTVDVFSKVSAAFTVAQLDSCSPFKIRVENLSFGGITDFIWKYNSTDSIVLHDFSSPDIPVYRNLSQVPEQHVLRLNVRNVHGCMDSQSDTVTIYPEVTAAFTADVDEGCHPLPVSFTNQTNLKAGTSYDWDFGDGTSSLSGDPVHVFKNYSHTDDASYTVRLTATSAYRCTSSASSVVTVFPKPIADFSYPVATACTPFDITFSNLSQGTGLTYEWDFDDGTTATEADPERTFYNYTPVTENRDIILVVTSDDNCSDTAVKPVSIFPGVQVGFTASSWDGCNPLEVSFDGDALNENEYYWYVDGKVISNSEDQDYRFVNSTGADKVFEVHFRAVSINGCFDDSIRQVTVHPNPVAEFLPEPQVQDFDITDDVTTVRIYNTTENQPAWDYQWDFGDGTASSEDDPAFLRDYSIWGDPDDESRIPVRLIATNAANPQCADTTLHYIIINPPPPLVELGNDISGCVPLQVSFSSTAKYVYPESYRWDFGFKNQGSAEMVPDDFTYDSAGVFIARLYVEGDGGSSWDYFKITVYPQPEADFTFAPDYVWVRSQTEAGTPVKFFNTTRLGEQYVWDFGDGSTSAEFQPVHEYMEVGTYYITLMAESADGCYDTLTHEIPVVVDGRGRLSFPNAITVFPDNPADEYYDRDEPDPRIFRPVAEGVEQYRLEIYNRWGELIFTSEDVNRGWNGFYHDEPVKQDVYVWRVTATFTNGRPFVRAGDVTVLVRKSGQ